MNCVQNSHFLSLFHYTWKEIPATNLHHRSRLRFREGNPNFTFQRRMAADISLRIVAFALNKWLRNGCGNRIVTWWIIGRMETQWTGEFAEAFPCLFTPREELRLTVEAPILHFDSSFQMVFSFPRGRHIAYSVRIHGNGKKPIL